MNRPKVKKKKFKETPPIRMEKQTILSEWDIFHTQKSKNKK